MKACPNCGNMYFTTESYFKCKAVNCCIDSKGKVLTGDIKENSLEDLAFKCSKCGKELKEEELVYAISCADCSTTLDKNSKIYYNGKYILCEYCKAFFKDVREITYEEAQEIIREKCDTKIF